MHGLTTNPIFQALAGLIIFYVGLKMFSGGMKSLGKLEHLEYYIHNTGLKTTNDFIFNSGLC